MRTLVDVLHEDGPPGMFEVDTLMGGLRDALTVEVVRDLGGADPPGHAQSAAYRIIEEALGNVVRHALAQRAWIRIAPRGARRRMAAAAPAARRRFVIVADHQEAARDGLRLLLSGEPDIDVIGAAADGAELVALARLRRRPR